MTGSGQKSPVWGNDISRQLRLLSNQHEYGKLWGCILRMYFPPQEGFVIPRPESTDTHILNAKAQEVHCGANGAVVLLRWEPYYSGAFRQKLEPLPSGSNLVRIYCVGTVVAYIARGQALEETLEPTENWVHDIFSSAGRRHLLNAFVLAWRFSSRDPATWNTKDIPDIGRAVLFLAEPVHKKRTTKRILKALTDNSMKTLSNTATSTLAGQQSFATSPPMEIAVMITKYLSAADVIALSTVNSQWNRASNHRLWATLWTSLHMRWSEFEPKAAIDSLLKGLAEVPARLSFIKSLIITCRWVWSQVQLEAFCAAFSQMNHLQELRLFEAPGPGATKGGDLTPLFAALLNYAEKTPDPLMNKSLTTLHCSVIMRKPNIPFIQFLRLQPQIEELHGADVLHNAPIQLPEDVLPNLKKYHAPSVRAALAWLRGRAVKLLVIPRIDSSNHVEILMDALTCSNAPVEELTVQDNAWGRITYREPQNNLLSRLAQISYPVVRLRIPAEYANMDASGDGEDVRLARLPKLQLFERI